jgi:DNA invertase Pin-like site-specific DNA recombinase
MKRVGIYLRVSTDNQTTDNQRRELAAVAARSGGTLSAFTKMPASAVPRGESGRPDFDRLLKDATARKINVIAAWSVDRLGRSMQHLVGLLMDLQALKCDLYLHQQALDTTLHSGAPCSRCAGSSPSSSAA